MYHLQGDADVEADDSLALPQLPIQDLPDIIEANRSQGRRAIRKAVRQWVKATQAS